MDVRYSNPVDASERKPRGEYQTGRRRRELILEKAAAIFADHGFAATSYREIAAACDLTPAGLAHHFTDKSAILLELLDRRERAGDDLQSKLDWREWLLEIERINRSNPVMTRLFVVLSAEATEVTHPAHDYFVQRYQTTREKFADMIRQQRSGRRITIDDRRRAQVLIAAWDGLQLQSTLDPHFGMRPAFQLAIELVSTSSTPPQQSTPPQKRTSP